MGNHLPRNGVVYDLGCGHGLFSLSLAQQSPESQVIGIDHDAQRIRLAKEAGRGLSNIRFESRDFFEVKGLERPQAISMIDVLHYFDFSTQESHLAQAWRLLSDEGF